MKCPPDVSNRRQHVVSSVGLGNACKPYPQSRAWPFSIIFFQSYSPKLPLLLGLINVVVIWDTRFFLNSLGNLLHTVTYDQMYSLNAFYFYFLISCYRQSPWDCVMSYDIEKPVFNCCTSFPSYGFSF